jgi:Xaa-Pro aminopeptidase
MAISHEIREKERRLRALMREKGLGVLLLKRQANFSWLTGGGLNLVGITTEVGASSLLITEKRKTLISNNIESPRMAAEEWKCHHQGGSIGYTGRDYRCHFQTPDIVQENQAFTWNPSLTGTKSEDTILAAARGMEMITRPILYPTLSVKAGGIAFVRPDILEKD